MIFRAKICTRITFICICVLLGVKLRVFAFESKTSYALSHYIMGVLYEDLGDVDRAIREYKLALRVERESAVIHLNLASGYIKKSDFPKAIEELKIAALLDPQAIEPHAILAILYSTQDKTDLATGEYERALKNASLLQPSNIDIYKNLGLIYLRQKRFKDAEQVYRVLVGLMPESEEAHLCLGSVYSELKQNELSEQELKRALALKPDYHPALNALGYLYVEWSKNLDQAEGVIKKAIELDPNNGAYLDSLGWLYFKKGAFKQALELLEKASALLADPVIYDHLGDAYLQMGDSVKAKDAWQLALKLDPELGQVKKKIEALKQAASPRPQATEAIPKAAGKAQ